MKRFIILVILLITVTGIGLRAADEEKTIQFKGLVQTWFSYGEKPEGTDDSPYGFTLRRVRIAPYGSFSKNVKWYFQAHWDKQVAGILDAYLDFLISEEFQIRVGQFSAPGAISGSLTSSGKLDFVERATVSERWNSNAGLSSFRAIGAQIHGEILNKKLYYAIMFANPKTATIFTPSIKDPEYAHDENGIMIWTRAEARPVAGLTLGAFYGGSKTTDKDFVRNSYGGHIYYVKNNLNCKIEYLAGEFGIKNHETKYNGIYGVIGYTFKKIEPILRYDIYTPNDNNPDSEGVEKYKSFTAGLNYYLNKNVKLQANYVNRTEEGTSLKNNLFYTCFQYTF